MRVNISGCLEHLIVWISRIKPMRSSRDSQLPMKTLVECAGFTILFASLWGCSAPPGLEGVKISEFDLTERFSLVAPRTDSDAREFDAHFYVTRKGSRKDSMVLTAPTAIHASLAEFKGPVELRCMVTGVFNVGDGIQLDIFLRENGTKKLIYNRYFDAGRLAEDRDWISLSVPLELKDSTENWLEVRVSGGPQGDLTADWLALNAMRIEPRK